METKVEDKKLVWHDKKARCFSKISVIGYFACWAVRQSPYLMPENLEQGIEEFSKGLSRYIEFPIMTLKELREIIDIAIKNSPIIRAWNVPKKGNPRFGVCSRYDRPKPDYDFIGLDALARNISHSVWLDILYSDGWFG